MTRIRTPVVFCICFVHNNISQCLIPTTTTRLQRETHSLTLSPSHQIFCLDGKVFNTVCVCVDEQDVTTAMTRQITNIPPSKHDDAHTITTLMIIICTLNYCGKQTNLANSSFIVIRLHSIHILNIFSLLLLTTK